MPHKSQFPQTNRNNKIARKNWYFAPRIPAKIPYWYYSLLLISGGIPHTPVVPIGIIRHNHNRQARFAHRLTHYLDTCYTAA